MPSTPAPRLSRINLPRMILWLASLVVAVGGYLLMTISNTREAAIYTAGTADYPKLFATQSGSTIGGLLIAVGVLGALLALTSMALTWKPRVATEAEAAPEAELDAAEAELDDEELRATPR
ncbi:hypothetical protein EDF46_2353 [Frondihabitans sp. PhB188]|uniref:hypothetical protein n=1 Tax=Frondihabitans sp. PhB188 TaxID=2485200 RepID=UPI000F4AF191|nr:hypothetical protein [Frondihabitans sp. PhB188]ROQ38712.1 hypothetical protein EDF46_2353 [Frondihabitans sp. PhB188]